MTKIRLAFIIIWGFLLSPDSYSKTVKVSDRMPLREQMISPFTTYVFKGVYDLQGSEIQCPEGSILWFKKGSLIQNGAINGNHTIIKAKKKVKGFFQDVTLSGTFENDYSYLSWWLLKDDITEEVRSLLAVFDKIIYLDCSGCISNYVYVTGKDCVIIDGCNNTFVLNNIPNNCFFAQKNKSVEFRNINISFLGCNTTGESAVIRCFRIEHSGQSIVSVHDISIQGFTNVNERPCSFNGINVVYCNEGTTTEIYNIKLKDITVKGDGIEIQSPGSNYGIVTLCNSSQSGKIDIHHSTMVNMSNIDSANKKLYEDTSGIYLAGRFSENGNTNDCHWNATVHDCYFEDISKRNVKVQGDYAVIKNLESNCTDSFLQDFKNMYVGAEGSHLTVKGLKGRYDGSIVKITGDYLSVDDINCSSALNNSEYARVFTLDGCTHATITNCTFDNDTYMFIYPTEKGFGPNVQPRYSFSRCKINVKHLIYCVSNQTQIFNKGILEVIDSDINLSSSICFNDQALREAVFSNSRVKYHKRLFSPKKDSGTIIITNNNSSLIRTQ